jgi:hypothetical protein
MKRVFSSRLIILIITIAIVVIADRIFTKGFREKKISSAAVKENFWIAPDTNSIPNTAEGELIRYGR